jgi:hypothetical protein
MNESIYSPEQEKEDRRYIMSKLELTENDMESILHAAPKQNSDYQTDSKIKKEFFSHFGPRWF